ncbi:formylglycine-generating enzyme family protein [Streptomyces zingiberis]|uniref:Formylglycine-generating enzyme family protein n=1 Tax=Streptomyces zingiberis TaxID=2053010 RepID=A0ABX1BVD7_9ACTN|nr:SUMF1/EgtB/PvdO family nonheme iron enzyme [Streptomyces zingiberis]NJQ00416.1 formylglycine-generating enzyme family protein [Streptomyces zingiberis]
MPIQQQAASFTMVHFPPGRFTIGSRAHTPRERPAHPVELGAYALADRCVSAGDYHRFLRAAPADVSHTLIDCVDPCFLVHRAGGFLLRPGCRDYPMIQISFWGAAAYCNWLSHEAGLRPVYDLRTRTADPAHGGYRLPTEAEWEAACRRGAPAPARCNSADAGAALRALRAGRARAGAFLPGQPAPVPVTASAPDRSGLHHMLGNVREWCHDRYGPYRPAPGGGPRRDPTGPAAGFFRVVRGGSFVDPVAACAAPRRMAAHEDTRCEVYGFRVARSR